MASLLAEEVRTYASVFARRALPNDTIDRLRNLYRTRARARRRKEAPSDRPPDTREQLAAALVALGLPHGKDVLVHAAYSALGKVEGGPASVVGAIRDVVGPNATILAPAYPMSSTMYEWMTAPEPFDVRNSRSRMGAISEYIRSQPDARRSAHPTHSVVALGPRADDYTAFHHRGDTPAGPHSPFWQHTLSGGSILCLGSGIGKVTSYHVIEDMVPDFPLKVYCPRPYEKQVCFLDGTSRQVRTLINDPDLSPWRVDNFKPKEEEILSFLIDGRAIKIGKVGDAQSHLINAAVLLTLMRTWLKEGITIYHKPRWGVPRRNWKVDPQPRASLWDL